MENRNALSELAKEFVYGKCNVGATNSGLRAVHLGGLKFVILSGGMYQELQFDNNLVATQDRTLQIISTWEDYNNPKSIHRLVNREMPIPANREQLKRYWGRLYTLDLANGKVAKLDPKLIDVTRSQGIWFLSEEDAKLWLDFFMEEVR